MKMIGISQRIVQNEQYPETRDALDQRWYALLNACGLLPVALPNDLVTTKALIAQIPFAGFILSGGNDHPARAATELFLLKKSLQENMPLLGICHGMQIIQQYFGLQLEKVSQHVMPHQMIHIHDQEEIVNSYHSYGTRETTKELLVWAKAQDGVVKAIRHISLPLMGIMWHPERFEPYAERDVQLIKTFFLEPQLCKA